MSHIRPDVKPRKHRKSECRKGRHRYGDTQSIGAGMARRVCDTCSAVTIDLTGMHLPGPATSAEPVPTSSRSNPGQ